MASILPTLKFIAQHPLSSQRPLSAYWRYARWQVESRLRDEVIFDWIGASKLAARNGMTGATGNIYCGLHEFVDMSFLLHLLRPGDLFVDVGANIGSYTVLASAVCKSHSIAVEPDPETVQALKRNIKVNGIEHLVTVIAAALGASAGTVRFTVGQDTTNRVAGSTDVATRHVQVRTLDEVLTGHSPVLIKMDIEGYEPEVVAGAAETLGKSPLLAIITETADKRVSSALEAAGFRTAAYEPFLRNLTLSAASIGGGSINTLFVRDLETCRARLETAPRRSIVGQAV